MKMDLVEEHRSRPLQAENIDLAADMQCPSKRSSTRVESSELHEEKEHLSGIRMYCLAFSLMTAIFLTTLDASIISTVRTTYPLTCPLFSFAPNMSELDDDVLINSISLGRPSLRSLLGFILRWISAGMALFI